MAYTFSRPITIAHGQCGSVNTTDFPMVVRETSNDLKNVAFSGHVQNANGHDIGFFADSALTTPLKWEIERYIQSTGELVAFVKIPTLSVSVDTVIYMAYGDAAITTFQGGALGSVWDANYSGVYHYPDGTTLTVLDSTANAKNGTALNAPSAATGQIGGCVSFDGTNDSVHFGNNHGVGATDFTFEVWAKSPATNVSKSFVNKRMTGSPFYQLSMGQGFVNSSGSGIASKQAFLLVIGPSGSQSYHTTADVFDGNFHHIVWRRTAGIVNIWVDGVSRALTADTANTTSVNPTNTNNFINGFDGGSQYWNGQLDEMRMTPAVARSDSHIIASYNNQKTSSTFYTLGSEISGPKSGSGSGAISVAWSTTTGSRPSQGSVTAPTVTVAGGSVTGSRSSQGAVTAPTVLVAKGVVTGVGPIPGVKQGQAIGAITVVKGTVTGRAPDPGASEGTTVGAVVVAGLSTGEMPPVETEVWVVAPTYMWDGNAWIPVTPKVWDGDAWVVATPKAYVP